MEDNLVKEPGDDLEVGKIQLKNKYMEKIENLYKEQSSQSISQEVFEKFRVLISKIDDNYLRNYKELDMIYKPMEYHEYEKVMKEIKDRESKGEEVSSVEKEAYMRQIRGKARKETIIWCEENDIRCPYELKQIKETLELFYPQYDMTDVRVFLIVKSIISHQLSAIRMARESVNKGILQEHYDKEGNLSYSLNPTEVAKMKFDDCIISAIAQLENITKGQKIKIDGELTVKDLMNQIIDVTPNKSS